MCQQQGPGLVEPFCNRGCLLTLLCKVLLEQARKRIIFDTIGELFGMQNVCICIGANLSKKILGTLVIN